MFNFSLALATYNVDYDTRDFFMTTTFLVERKEKLLERFELLQKKNFDEADKAWRMKIIRDNEKVFLGKFEHLKYGPPYEKFNQLEEIKPSLPKRIPVVSRKNEMVEGSEESSNIKMASRSKNIIKQKNKPRVAETDQKQKKKPIVNKEKDPELAEDSPPEFRVPILKVITHITQQLKFY